VKAVFSRNKYSLFALAGPFATLAILGILSCNNISTKSLDAATDEPNNVNEIDAATIEGIAIDSETGGIGLNVPPTPTTCSLSIARASCSGNVSDVLWSSCLLTSGSTTVVLSGGWTDTYDSNATCTAIQGGNVLPANANVIRTATAGFKVALTNGVGLTTDTNAHTTYFGEALPTTGVSTASDGSGNRTVYINNLHLSLKTGGGTLLYEQDIVAQGLSMTGDLNTSNRVVNGTLTTYHETAKYTSVSTFAGVTWGSSTCCFPTSGTITTVLSGAYTGTQSMVFGTPCGVETFVDTSGGVSKTVLQYCM
jgi:hypothetical protein